MLQCSFDENLKNRFFRKKFKKVCVLQRKHEPNFKFQTQLSRKLQRFRTCRKNKKCSIFHELSEYQQKWQLFSHSTGPLILSHASLHLNQLFSWFLIRTKDHYWKKPIKRYSLSKGLKTMERWSRSYHHKLKIHCLFFQSPYRCCWAILLKELIFVILPMALSRTVLNQLYTNPG